MSERLDAAPTLVGKLVQSSPYAGAITSIGAGLTLERIGIFVGILVAIVTLLINWYYQHRRNEREEKRRDEEHQEHLKRMRDLTKDGDEPD